MDLKPKVERFRGAKLDRAGCALADTIAKSLPTLRDQILFWKGLIPVVSSGEPKGHIYFRLGTLHLLEGKSSLAIRSFREAYEQDRQFHPANTPAEAMSAYRILCFLVDFLKWIRSPRRRKHWREWATHREFREKLVKGLFGAYDGSIQLSFMQPSHNLVSFRRAIKRNSLRTFCWENYRLALELILFFDLESNPLSGHAYATARSVAGLLGGALEAILQDQLRRRKIRVEMPLGPLIDKCYEVGVIKEASTLDVFCVVLLYFRNLIHANATGRRKFIFNMNNAKTLKMVFDFALLSLLQQLKFGRKPSASTTAG